MTQQNDNKAGTQFPNEERLPGIELYDEYGDGSPGDELKYLGAFVQYDAETNQVRYRFQFPDFESRSDDHEWTSEWIPADNPGRKQTEEAIAWLTNQLLEPLGY